MQTFCPQHLLASDRTHRRENEVRYQTPYPLASSLRGSSVAIYLPVAPSLCLRNFYEALKVCYTGNGGVNPISG